ncbi:LmbE family N-acetylglucosaminyl deacetylase [Actinomadura pelletieri DSM 43383]|uniref:LmbE family N-acetylglucosaminyl deacetylase n=1 Tax=Actinomadura pelletieri DSM 43383 TaxID=1120940 RepID=A0A495QB78_9ACTN|nr:PIG-L deacetylase family protein [Actinomadura pelletieri]RKS68791.1 LmbE family N-acetylglucosaminyl deacetylase [Actinomadura pelletieri DSM 43383]
MDEVPEDWERALALVAHPDDVEYGTSAAIAKWTGQGKTVVEVMATRGEAGIDSMEPDEVARIRSAEQVEAARIVGVETVEFLDFPDGVLEYRLPLRRSLAAAIRRHRPEVVLSLNFRETFPGGGFNMADHRVLGLAVADAIRDAANRWVFRDLGLDPWQGVRFALFGGSPRATHYVDVTGHLRAGIDSLLAHEVYFSNLGAEFDAAAFLTGAAEEAGRAVGVEHAITFEMIEG